VTAVSSGAQFARFAVAAQKAFARVEGRPARAGAVGRDLAGGDGQVDAVILDEVPGVGRKAMPDVLDEVGGPEQRERAWSAQADPQQSVETHEMIHVGMRHEDVTRPQDLARGQGGDVAQVEQERSAIKLHVHEQARVREWPVDEAGLEDRTHAGDLRHILGMHGISAHP
jgi:hypothetical protein